MKGQCLCGAITISAEPPSDFVAHCHCESCRKAHGAAFVTWLGLPSSQFKVLEGAGKLGVYESSPGAQRRFCSVCGTPLMMTYDASHAEFGEASAGTTYVPAAIFNDPFDRPPSAHVSFEEQPDWMELAHELPRFRAKTDEAM